MNLPEQFAQYLNSQKAKPSKATVKNYKADIAQFIHWFEKKFGKTFDPVAITPQIIEIYKSASNPGATQEKPEHQLSPRSLKRHISSLRKFFNFLKIEGIISQDPTRTQPALAQSSTPDTWHLKDFKNYLYVYNASPLTIKNYVMDVKHFMEWAQQSTGTQKQWEVSQKNIFDKLNWNLIESYKNVLIAQHFSPLSINRKLSSLRKYLAWTKEEGLIKKEAEIVRPQIKQQDTGIFSAIPSRPMASPNTASKPQDRPKTNYVPVPQRFSTPPAAEEEPKAEDKISSEYSKIPPLRLVQKIVNAGDWLFDAIFIEPIAIIIKAGEIVLWKLRGKPVFENSKSKEAIQVYNIKKKFYSSVSTSEMSLPQKTWHHVRFTRPQWYKNYHSRPFVHYLHFGVLVILMSMLGFYIFQFLNLSPNSSFTQVAQEGNTKRTLVFQGKLADSKGNPLTGPTSVKFNIYDAVKKGDKLWTETNSIIPKADGTFSVYLGSKTPLYQEMFVKNYTLWLGISVGSDPEITPRQQLTNVALSENAQTLDGLPPITRSKTGNKNVVLALDSSGNLTIGGKASSTFQAIGGEFTLSGNVLSLTTIAGTDSDIILEPDGLGKVDIRKPIYNSSNSSTTPGADGAVEIADSLFILASSSAQSAFTINQTDLGALISASSSGIAKFTVDVLGNTTITGDLILNGKHISASGLTDANFGNSSFEIGDINATGNFSQTGATTFYTGTGNTNINGNIILGDSASDTFTFTGRVAQDSDLIPITTTGASDLGAANFPWSTLYVKQVKPNGQDGQQGWWTRSGTTLSPSNSADNVSVGGTLGVTGLISANGGVTIASGKSLTLAGLTSNGGVLYTNGSGVVAQATAGTSTQVLHGGTTPTFGAVVLTSDVSGVLPIANGGTNGTATPTAGGVTYGTGTAYAFSAAGTSGQFLISGGSGAPTWTTTIPATSVPFSGITSGTNTTAAMLVGTGASLGFTGSGTIDASSLIGATWVAPGTIGSTTPNTGAFTTLTSSGNTTLGTGASGTHTYSTGAGSTTTLGNSTGALTIASGGTSAWTNTSGNLTISTATSGTLALSSAGVLNLTSALAAGGTTNSAFNITTSTNLGATDELLQIGDSAGTFVTVLGNGSVGIGMINPTALLDVAGSINTTSTTASYQIGNSTVLHNTGTRNIFLGISAGNTTLTGTDITALGYQAGTALTSGIDNVFVGTEAGKANTSGGHNTFLGFEAGFSNTTASFNTFLGDSAGFANTTGANNLFVGVQAGSANTTGILNAFFGNSSGLFNTTGGSNTFIGESSGFSNTTASNNTFIGNQAGFSNTTATGNVFVGYLAGDTATAANANVTGANNTFIGYQSGPGSTTQLTNATAIGYQALVNCSNCLVLGSSVNVGAGTASPAFKLDVQDSQSATVSAQFFNTDTGVNADGIIVKLGNSSSTVVSTTNHFVNFETSGIGIVGSIQGNGGKNVAYVTNGIADFAEYLPKDPNQIIDYGVAVCIHANGNVSPCSKNDTKIAGVTSEHPTFLGGENRGDGSIVVGLSGQIVTKVSKANGPISPGDSIAITDGGIGVKALGPGMIIGKALGNLESSSGKIIVLVQPGYYGGIDSYITALTIAIQNGTYQLLDDAGRAVGQIGAFSKATIGELAAGAINVSELVASNLVASRLVSPIAEIDIVKTNLISPLASGNGSIIVRLGGQEEAFPSPKFEIQNASGSAIASIDDTGNATFSGTLTADGLRATAVDSRQLTVNDATISGTLSSNSLNTTDATVSGTLHAGNILADNIEGLNARIQQLAISKLATSSADFLDPSLVANSLVASGSAIFSNLAAETATFNQGLIALGPSSLMDTSVIGQLSINSSLILADNSINVLGADLEIQPFRQGGVSFLSGLVHIDSEGNLIVGGNADFAKDVTVRGKLFAGLLSPIPDGDIAIILATKSGELSQQFQIKNSTGSAVLAVNNLGDIIASGTATVNKLNFNIVSPALALSATEALASGSAGVATISAHQTQLTIHDSLVTDKSLIYITPVGNTFGQTPYLLRQLPETGTGDGSFTSGIQLPSGLDTTFNWLIVN